MVSESELEELKISTFSIFDPDWNSHIQDITGLQIVRRSHLESGSSLSIIDSPLKYKSFFYFLKIFLAQFKLRLPNFFTEILHQQFLARRQTHRVSVHPGQVVL